MQPKGEGGADEIANAIPLCFECHAEIHSYNDKHPRGRKFRPKELKQHKENWLEICAKNPAALIDTPRDIAVGPLQSLIDELQFNSAVIAGIEQKFIGPENRCSAALSNTQFQRAIESGAISVLDDDLRKSLLSTYAEIGKVKLLMQAYLGQSEKDALAGAIGGELKTLAPALADPVESALTLLLGFLGHGDA
ncbi:hypothetical protein HG15A2_23420 [Adhaeretor mobilis]|uniref:HNH endonuclease n=2 Tax=Adhaeretor mobilis TaxID=1930276 RepID=A0A517MVZ2_9BACT|nr:hypothetical protein HG15A2_23420 [Adhaeretor mobilis]